MKRMGDVEHAIGERLGAGHVGLAQHLQRRQYLELGFTLLAVPHDAGFAGDGRAVLVSHQVLEKDAQREGQAAEIADHRADRIDYHRHRLLGHLHRAHRNRSAAAAFDLSKEPDSVRERYGRHSWGQSHLLARRLVESGVRFVNVTWDLFWDRIAIDYDAWDTHEIRAQAKDYLPLAFLAPKIVRAILDGKQPADLSLKQLMYRTDLPVDWASQTSQLGFVN